MKLTTDKWYAGLGKTGFIQNRKYWVPVLLWMSLIFWFSTGTFSAQNTALIIEPLLRFFMPSISVHGLWNIHLIIRKLGHLAVYFILGLLLFRSFRGNLSGAGILRLSACSILCVVLYALSDELHQSYVSMRHASLFDVGIDTLGGILAQSVSVVWSYRHYK